MVFNKKRILMFGGIGFAGSGIVTAFIAIQSHIPATAVFSVMSVFTVGSLVLGIAIDLLLPLFNLINIDALKRPLAFLNQGEKKILRSKKLLDAGVITEQEYQKRVRKFRASME